MELQMLFDVPDMPANLSQWDFNEIGCDGMLHVPSCNAFGDWKVSKDIEYISEEEKATSDLSLSSTPSDVSSRLNHHDLGLNFEVDYLTEQHTLQSPSPRNTKPTLDLQLPSTRLNLKLDLNHVATTWSKLTHGQSSIFTIPKHTISITEFPSMSTRTASISVDSIPEYNDLFNQQSTSDHHTAMRSQHLRSPFIPTTAAIPTLSRHASVTKKISSHSSHQRSITGAPRPASHSVKRSTHKRARSGKSNDKRPRIKGRFVKREEFERMMAAEQPIEEETPPGVVTDGSNRNDSIQSDTAVVPENSINNDDSDVVIMNNDVDDDMVVVMGMADDDDDDLLHCCSLTASATTSVC